MKAQKGFTIVEAIISFLFIFIVGMILAGVVPLTNSGSSIQMTVNGMVQSTCIDGYKFMVGHNGEVRQVMSELGHGVRCEQDNQQNAE